MESEKGEGMEQEPKEVVEGLVYEKRDHIGEQPVGRGQG